MDVLIFTVTHTVINSLAIETFARRYLTRDVAMIGPIATY